MNFLDNPYLQGAALYGVVNLFLSAIIASLPKPEEVLRKDGKISLLYRTFYSLLSALVFDFKSIAGAMAQGKTIGQAVVAVAATAEISSTNSGTGGTTN